MQSMTNGSTHTGAPSVTSSAFEEDLNQVYSSSLDDYNVTDPIGKRFLELHNLLL